MPAMQHFPFLKANSWGAKFKASWSNDTPLMVAEGGTLPWPSDDEFKNFKDSFLSKGKLTRLGVLASLETALSQQNFKFDLDQLEKLGRKMFTTGNPDDMDVRELLSDDFFVKHQFDFPKAWNEKVSIPVQVIDLGLVPKKKFILAMDEVILAFWKMVDKLGGMIANASKDQEKKDIKEKLEEHLTSARLLQRNVPFVFYYTSTQKDSDRINLTRARGGIGMQ